MSTNRVLVTGATGFIGTRLVQHLIHRGDKVTCLARKTSNVSSLARLDCEITFGDTVQSLDSLISAAANIDTVYHLAASTHAVRSRDLLRINNAGTRNILSACESQPSPPKLVIVSSLAAVGPSSGSQLHIETDARKPFSFYGKSKAACELAAIERAQQLQISIVRPPIVLGGGDRHGFELFRLIEKWGWHFVPGLSDKLYSMIHVDDLVGSLIAVADRGKRLSSNTSKDAQGIYFASHGTTLTYAELGKLIGKSLGRERTKIIRVPKFLMRALAGLNELRGRIQRSPEFVNLDKFREAFTGSWACSGKKLFDETGFNIRTTMLARLQQTSDWYRRHGWLPDDRIQTPSRCVCRVVNTKVV